MEKIFSIELPKEPYSSDMTDAQTITCTYTGNRYISVVVDKDTNKLINYVDTGEEVDDIDLDGYVPQDNELVVTLDANSDPVLASLLTLEYTHDVIDDYVEVLSTGEEYRVVYPGPGGILDFVYNRHSITYTDGQFNLPLESVPVDDDNMLNTVNIQLENHKQLKAEAIDNGKDDEVISQYNEMISWLETYEDTYIAAGIPAHKVPWPVFDKI